MEERSALLLYAVTVDQRTGSHTSDRARAILEHIIVTNGQERATTVRSSLPPFEVLVLVDQRTVYMLHVHGVASTIDLGAQELLYVREEYMLGYIIPGPEMRSVCVPRHRP